MGLLLRNLGKAALAIVALSTLTAGIVAGGILVGGATAYVWRARTETAPMMRAPATKVAVFEAPPQVAANPVATPETTSAVVPDDEQQLFRAKAKMVLLEQQKARLNRARQQAAEIEGLRLTADETERLKQAFARRTKAPSALAAAGKTLPRTGPSMMRKIPPDVAEIVPAFKDELYYSDGSAIVIVSRRNKKAVAVIDNDE